MIFCEHEIARNELAIHLVKVLEFFPGDVHHGRDQPAAIRVVADEGERDRGSFALRGGVVEQKSVKVAKDTVEPVGRGQGA